MLTLTEIDMIAERVVRMMKPADEIMNIERAAEYLGTTTDALSKRVERRQVPFHKQGKLLYFSRNELNGHGCGDDGKPVRAPPKINPLLNGIVILLMALCRGDGLP